MPPPTTSTSNVCAVNRSMSRVMGRARRTVVRPPNGRRANSIVSGVATTAEVREYWERHIHDLEITRHPVGSRGFFADLDQYHFEKLHHLLRLVNFDGYKDRSVL